MESFGKVLDSFESLESFGKLGKFWKVLKAWKVWKVLKVLKAWKVWFNIVGELPARLELLSQLPRGVNLSGADKISDP